jgi:hypothetical protein
LRGARDDRLVGLDARVGQGIQRLAGRPGVARHVLGPAPAPVGVLPLLDALDQRLPFLGRVAQSLQRTRRIAIDCGSSSVFGSVSHRMPWSQTDLAESSPAATVGSKARVASAVMLSSELPKLGGLVPGHVDHEPFSVCSLFTVFKRSFKPCCAMVSGWGSAPSASENHTTLGVSAWGALVGLAGANLPSPDSATHFVIAARTGASTGRYRSDTF